jgi:hypothetical protein
MSLWIAWWEAIVLLRPAFSRLRSFMVESTTGAVAVGSSIAVGRPFGCAVPY